MKTPTIEASRWVGRVLRDKWRIDARIARGGVGTVFAATHRNNGSRVAIKVLHTELSRDADTRSRFLQEGYAANKVNHPGVVRILDDDVTEEGLAFLVMELLEGELLERRRMRKGGKLPIAEIPDLADQLLDVLAAAHDKQIVHRDIKPDNLFVTSEGRLKVLDFGFAQMKSGFRKETTATGFLLGTPGFMSPEQAVGNRARVDAQTDIWAVGATLFTLISGEPVHAADSAAEMLVASANYPARSLSSVVKGISPALVRAVDKALAFDKANRWPSARAMQSALRQVFGGPTARDLARVMPDLSEHDPNEEMTVADKGLPVEELSARELVDAQPSWQTDKDRTLPHLPEDGDATRAADAYDDPTLARVPKADDAAPTTPAMMDRSSSDLPPPSSGPGTEGTLVMATSANRSGPYAAIQQGFAVPPPRAAFQTMPDARHGGGDPIVAAEAQRPASPRGNGVLVFVAVAAVSMAIVILTGLLVLAAAD